MLSKKILSALESDRYSALATSPKTQGNIESLCLGGSLAYGLALPESDIDIRGFCLRSSDDILVGYDFEQFENKETDTTLYTYPKFLHLLSKANPGTLEWLGLRAEDIIWEGEIAKLIRASGDKFLTQRVVHTFGGFATQQYKRLQAGQASKGLAKSPYKAAKYMCHIIRLYDMGTEILSSEGIKTYRKSDRQLLLDIKLGKYQKEDGKPTPEFWEILSSSENKFNEAKIKTKLPEQLEENLVKNLLLKIAKMIVFDGYTGKSLNEITTRTKKN